MFKWIFFGLNLGSLPLIPLSRPLRGLALLCSLPSQIEKIPPSLSFLKPSQLLSAFLCMAESQVELSSLWLLTGLTPRLCVLHPQGPRTAHCNVWPHPCWAEREDHLPQLTRNYSGSCWPPFTAGSHCWLMCCLLPKRTSVKILSSWLDPSLLWWGCSSLIPWTLWGFYQPISSVYWGLSEWHLNSLVSQTLLTILHHLYTCWGCTLSYYLHS